MMSKEMQQQRRDEIDEFLNGPDYEETCRLRQRIKAQGQIIDDMQSVYDKAMNAIELSGCLYERAMCGDEEAWEHYKGLLSALLMLGLCHEDDRAHLSMTLKEAKDRQD